MKEKNKENKEINKNNLKCKSKILQFISDMIEIDDPMNSIYSFEQDFNNWDHDVLILSSWKWNRENRRENDSYLYIENIGVYDDISILARALQHLFLKINKKEKINIEDIGLMYNGDQLIFNFYKEGFINNIQYRISFMDLNQRKPDSKYEGYKFDSEQKLCMK